MKKKEIIKKSIDYTNIINSNNKIKNKYYSIFLKKDENTLFGISIPKKLGSAVTRNKIKRQIKNIIDINKKYIPKNYNYVIILKEPIINLSYGVIEKELLDLLKKVRN